MHCDGYIKLWRKSLDSGLMQNPELWTFWCWCLLKASHQPFRMMVGMQSVDLLPGQFVFGRHKASIELGLTERKIRTCVQVLEKMQNVTIKTTNKFSLITIVNWDSYQQNGQANDQQNDQQTTNKRPTNDQQTTTNKNGKNVKKVKKKESGLKSTPPTLAETCQYFLENGFSDTAARKAWEYYEAGGWKDSTGKPVKNWKQKMRGVWFRDEHKAGKAPAGKVSRSDQNMAACQSFINGAPEDDDINKLKKEAGDVRKDY